MRHICTIKVTWILFLFTHAYKPTANLYHRLPEKLEEGCETIRAVKFNELMQVHTFGWPIWPEFLKTQLQHVLDFTHWRVLLLRHYSIKRDQHRGICPAGGMSPFTKELLTQSNIKHLCGRSVGRSLMPNSSQTALHRQGVSKKKKTETKCNAKTTE